MATTMLSRSLTAAPLRAATRRPLLGQWRSGSSIRGFRSYDTSPPPPSYSSPEAQAILGAAMRHVPEHGFSSTALRQGARDSGYLDVSTNLFPRGAMDLIEYHLVTQRRTLAALKEEEGNLEARIRTLLAARLRGNEPIIHQWQDALATMAQPTHVPASLAELARLADDVCFLAGDTAVDGSWYTRRAALSTIYASTEVFMTQDKSPRWVETQEFLDRRLEEMLTVGTSMANVAQWVDFTGHAFVNTLRSKGVRI